MLDLGGAESTVILNGKAGIFSGITTGVYNKAVQSKWTGKDNMPYYSHSQLAFCTNESKMDGFDNALGLNNNMVETYSSTEDKPHNTLTDMYEPQIITENMNEDTELFCSTTGELHYYSDTSGD